VSRKETEKQELTFEQAMARLEEIVDGLERGEGSLEESIARFEEAAKLARFCEQQLKGVEGKLQKLIEKRGGVELEPLAEEPDEA
jgi:exodeoxyribonuclease VII small subunit